MASLLRATGLYRKKLIGSAHMFRRTFAMSQITMKPPNSSDKNSNIEKPKEKETPPKWEEYSDLPPSKWRDDILKETDGLQELLDKITAKQKKYEEKYGKYLLAAEAGIVIDPPLPLIRPEFMPLQGNLYDILAFSGLILADENELSLMKRMKEKVLGNEKKDEEKETEVIKSDTEKFEK